MIEQTVNPTTISNFVNSQFPNFFKENGPQFVAFVKAYYEWLETFNQPVYLTRRYYDIKDIDQTLDEFIVFFKNKYLIGIDFDTTTDIRHIIKHALDIYRSKGTPRELKLLFGLVYGKDVDLYYPSTDLFKLSDGNWFQPKYIELKPSTNNILYYHKEIIGATSGAIAFVDDVIRKNIKGALTDVAYISAISGNFVTGEILLPVDGSIDITQCTTMIGSLTSIEVSPDGTGSGYHIGDITTYTSLYGAGGLLRVNTLGSKSGIIDFSLVDGGYGFSANAWVYTGNASLTISNVVQSNAFARNYWDFEDLITEEKVSLNYINANGFFGVGNNITTYFSNGGVMGTGSIIALNQSNTTAGTITAIELSGSLNNVVYTTANAIIANLALSNGYSNATSVGLFVANTTSVDLTLNNIVGTINSSDTIFGAPTPIYPQTNRIRGTVSTIDTNSNTYTLANVQGLFVANQGITTQNGGITANVASIRIRLGVLNQQSLAITGPTGSFIKGELLRQGSTTLVANSTFTVGSGLIMGANTTQVNFNPLNSNTFIVTTNANTKITGAVSGATANVSVVNLLFSFMASNTALISSKNVTGNLTKLSPGSGATYAVANLTSQETILYNTDLIDASFGTLINAASYAFLPNGSTSNYSSVSIGNSFSFANVTIGRINSLFTTNPGVGYVDTPLIRVFEPDIAPYKVLDDRYITISGAASNFIPGETITQGNSTVSTNARGLVRSGANITFLPYLDLRFYSNADFALTTNTGSQIIGVQSGVVANITGIFTNSDYSSIEGDNLTASILVGTANSGAAGFDVIDSGFGHIEGETISLGNNNGTALVHLGSSGHGKGYYKEKGGFLSDQKRLYDNFFWQNYSYEIISGLMLDKYQSMVNQVAHVAGTKMFGRFVHASVTTDNTAITTTTITQA
jgi:hypothetical protein